MEIMHIQPKFLTSNNQMQDFQAYLVTPYCSYKQLLQNNLRKKKLITMKSQSHMLKNKFTFSMSHLV